MDPVRDVVATLKPAPAPAWKLEQARLLRERPDDVRTDFGMLSSADVESLGGRSSSNTSANPTRWARRGKVAAIKTNDGYLYPGFQFDLTTGQPLALIAILLATWRADDAVGFTLWCTAPNEWLDGARPVDQFHTHPVDVRGAITHAVET